MIQDDSFLDEFEDFFETECEQSEYDEWREADNAERYRDLMGGMGYGYF
jgi:hypothetical protein